MTTIETAINTNRAKLNAILIFANDYVWPLKKAEDILNPDTLIQDFYQSLYENEAFLSAAHAHVVAMADLTIPQLSLAFREMANDEIKNTSALAQIIQNQLLKTLGLLRLG